MKARRCLFNVFLVTLLVLGFSGSLEAVPDVSCGKSNDPCIQANNTLASCGFYILPPTSKAPHYGITSPLFARCACNQDFYTALSQCLTCFSIPAQPDSLSQFQTDCLNNGVSFTQTAPGSGKSGSDTTKTIIIAVCVVVGVIILACGVFYIIYQNKRKKNQDPVMATASPSSSTRPNTLASLVNNPNNQNMYQNGYNPNMYSNGYNQNTMSISSTPSADNYVHQGYQQQNDTMLAYNPNQQQQNDAGLAYNPNQYVPQGAQVRQSQPESFYGPRQ